MPSHEPHLQVELGRLVEGSSNPATEEDFMKLGRIIADAVRNNTDFVNERIRRQVVIYTPGDQRATVRCTTPEHFKFGPPVISTT